MRCCMMQLTPLDQASDKLTVVTCTQQEAWTERAAAVINERIALYAASEIKFNLLALVKCVGWSGCGSTRVRSVCPLDPCDAHRKGGRGCHSVAGTACIETVLSRKYQCQLTGRHQLCRRFRHPSIAPCTFLNHRPQVPAHGAGGAAG